MEEFENDLKQIVDNYLSMGYITQEIHDEYIVFIKAMLCETNKILNEKLKREEEKLRKYNMKINIKA